jgi:superfamily II DNA or RNA helicase
MVSEAVKRGKTCYFVVHRQELIDQTSLTFTQLGIAHGFIAADEPYEEGHACYIVSIDTMAARVRRDVASFYPQPDLVILDEAHHAVAPTWAKVIKHWKSAALVGLTATPERLDGRGLGEIFDSIVSGPSVFNLIEDGWLSGYRLLTADIGVDPTMIATMAGEYNRSQLAEMMDDAKLVGGIVDHWEREAKGLVTLAFGVNRSHSRHIAEAFTAAGYPFAHLDATTPRAERAETLRRLARKEIIGVCNVGLFGEGFDLEANANFGNTEKWLEVTVECVISARPTASLSVWLQQVGRALRKKDAEAVILDHAGNTWVHGLPDDQRTWDLKSKSRKKGGKVAVKHCPLCLRLLPASAQHCPCGWKAPMPPPPPVPDHADLGLVEMIRDEADACDGFEDFVALALRRGYERPFAWARGQSQRKLEV